MEVLYPRRLVGDERRAAFCRAESSDEQRHQSGVGPSVLRRRPHPRLDSINVRIENLDGKVDGAIQLYNLHA